jgi:hypothetical protein
MANYTISTYTASLTASAAVANSVTLTITPDAGYVVSASDFSIGTAHTGDSSNPINVSTGSAAFSDTTTAGALGNTVECLVDLFDAYVMPAANTTFTVDIDGDAVLWNAVDGGGSNEVDTVVHVIDCGSDATVAYAIAGGSSLTSISGHHGKSGQRVTKTGITANSVTKIATITVTASGSNEFLKAPVLRHGYTSRSIATTEDMLSLDLEGVTATSGKTTVYTFGLNYRASKDFTVVDDITVCVDYETVLAVALANSITKIDYGSDYVSHLGETRTISIYGKQGATFTYGLTNTAGTVIATTATQTIPYAGDFNTGQGVFTFDAAIPATDSSTVTLTVTPVSPTVNPATSDQTDIANAIDQKKETDIDFSVTAGGGGVGAVTMTTSVVDLETTKTANTNIEDLMHKRGTVDHFLLKFAVGSGSFDYNVRNTPVWNYELSSATVSGDATVTVASTTNLKAGMYVHGTGIRADAVISSITDPTTFELDNTATATGTSTLTYSSWSKSVAATNGGTVINITNIIETGSTSAYTFDANVSIGRYGSTDVVIDLPLANILKVS